MKTLLFTTATALCLAGASHAQSVSADNPFSIAAVMQDLGYDTALTTDDYGDPMIETDLAGVYFDVLFYGCTDGHACKDIQLRASFETSGSVSQNTLNTWNRDHFFGKAYLVSDGDTFFEHSVVGVNDMPRANFERLMQRWGSSLNSFTEAIDW